MDVMELFSLLRHAEDPHTEFKREFPPQANEVAKEMAALANSGGGVLLMGVDDDGTPSGIQGVKAADLVIQRLAGLARSPNMRPALSPEIDKVAIGDDRYVVYARIQPSHYCLFEDKLYIRVGTTCQKVTDGSELRKLFGSETSGGPKAGASAPSALFTPPPARAFKGRAHELSRLTGFLHSPNVSVVVIEGISGIGKTTLAAHFAATVAQQSHSVFWLDCREDTLFDSVTSALGHFARAGGNEALADTIEDVTLNAEERLVRIAAAIGEHKFALFFNDYHLVRDPSVNRLLQKIAERCIHPKLFLTSRWRPRLAASVSPVALVEEQLRTGLDRTACAQILSECAVNVSQDVVRKVWALTGEGHPKALEIFIARARNYPVPELLTSLPVFKEELKNEWLNPLMEELPQEQRELAVDLSVFDRPLTLQSMKTLYPDKDVGHAIVGLVDRFILDRAAETSLQMHPLIRDFCYGLIPDVRAQHVRAAEYYLQQAGPWQDREMVSDAQIDAHVAAWSHLIKAEEYSKAEEELDKLRSPLMNRGNYEQAMFLIEQTPLSEQNRDWYAIHKARILSLWGDFDAAVALVLPLVDSPTDGIAREAILVLATIYHDHNRADLLKGLLEENRERFMRVASPRVRRRFLYRLVEAYSMAGDGPRALEWARKVYEVCEAENDEISGAVSLRQMANVLHEQKNHDFALSICQTSHELLSKHRRLRDLAITKVLMASIYKELSDYDSALNCLQDSLDIFTDIGDRRNLSMSKQRLKELNSFFEAKGSDAGPAAESAS
jgi:tetratricopeptide (TPR) repeat protein